MNSIRCILKGWGMLIIGAAEIMCVIAPFVVIVTWLIGNIHGAWAIICSIMWLSVIAYFIGQTAGD